MSEEREIKINIPKAPNIPIPACVVSEEGKILSANSVIEKVFPYGDVEEQDFFALSGVKMKTLKASVSNASGDSSPEAKTEELFLEPIVIERNNRKFSIIAERVTLSEKGASEKDDSEKDDSEKDASEILGSARVDSAKRGSAKSGSAGDTSEKAENEICYMVFFYDVTSYEEIRDRYDREKICVCRINVDNYDQFTDSVSSETGMAVSSELNKIIRKWAATIEGAIDRTKETQYVIHFQRAFLDELVSGKFAILDEVRGIETGVDFPLSLSIGVGMGGKDISETSEFAAAALDLALGRGGDQAVVKNENRIQYYGGKTQSVEKSNKGKSRIVGHALKKLVEQANRVLIMGHRHGDMDSFGSSMGIYRICLACGTEAYIVIDEISESIRAFYDQVRDSQNYNIIGTEQALTMVEKDTLVVVLDTHRPSYLEAAELLDLSDQIVVIDHHRRAEDIIESPTLSYIETYASSTAELVTEMLQYVLNRKTLVRLEAEALMAGMTIDTNRFAMKTGVRTFEAAAWLRRSGADTTEIKRYFQMGEREFKIKAKAIADAVIHEKGIATSITFDGGADVQVINAQVADELLNIKGVKASIVAGKNNNNKTSISARSLGDMNVQILLEKFGGGGHLSVAGAQVDEEPEEIIEKILAAIEESE